MNITNNIHELAEKITRLCFRGVAVHISDDYSLYDDEIVVLGTNLRVQIGLIERYYSVNEDVKDGVIFHDVESEAEVIEKINEILNEGRITKR